MTLKTPFFASLLVLGAGIPAFAQVEKVAMRTTGISCGMCAAVSEVYLRQLPSIDKIKISLSNEAVMVSYKPGAGFQPKELRDALKKTDVGIVQFQISARGRIQEQEGKRFFVAGKDKFLIARTAGGVQMAADTPLLIEATVNDHQVPMELNVMTAKPLQR